MKSIEQWCRSHHLDVHIQNRRKYVYEHELLEVLEYNYVSDTMKMHPSDFVKRCSEKVSNRTLMKFSGYTATNLNVTSNSYSYLPKDIQKLLNAI